MRIFALSDIHVDYGVNEKWVRELPDLEYRDDVLILAGDVSDRLQLLEWCLAEFTRRFRHVLFVPGNHDLWVVRDSSEKISWDKFRDVAAVVKQTGASMTPFLYEGLYIVPLQSWYDFSFGEPCEKLRGLWADFRTCRWPQGTEAPHISERFAAMNPVAVPVGVEQVVTFSHFMPRIDLMPSFVPSDVRMLFPVLGSSRIDVQLRKLGSRLHVYGHSHLNRKKIIDGVTYVNNAFGYPHEELLTAKKLVPIIAA